MLVGVVVTALARRHRGRWPWRWWFFALLLLVQRDFWLPALVTLALFVMAVGSICRQFGSLQRRFAEAFKGRKDRIR